MRAQVPFKAAFREAAGLEQLVAFLAYCTDSARFEPAGTGSLKGDISELEMSDFHCFNIQKYNVLYYSKITLCIFVHTHANKWIQSITV